MYSLEQHLEIRYTPHKDTIDHFQMTVSAPELLIKNDWIWSCVDDHEGIWIVETVINLKLKCFVFVRLMASNIVKQLTFSNREWVWRSLRLEELGNEEEM